MSEPLIFPDRETFRQWLQTYGATNPGVWLLFGKKGGPQTLKASEALEEALCFGWIDGQMQSIDDTAYQKYFARRTANSQWSEKNKALSAKLTVQGLMTDAGREKIAEAKMNGQWDAQKPAAITDTDIARLTDLLAAHQPAHSNFLAMSLSVKRTYARAYFDAKTDAGKESRLSRIIDRLNKNLKPM